MLRDVFYYGEKPNAHPKEKHATSLEDALAQSTTEHFWIINEYCDYRGFDWEFDFELLPDEDVWATDHTNVWPSQYQKDSGTWLCSENNTEIIIYRADVDPIPRKETIAPNWVIPNDIDKTLFDFKWHPDPTDPPYIYQFCTQWQKTGGPKYVVDGATEVKYLSIQIAKKLPNVNNWEPLRDIDTESFDFSWHPDESEPPYIYEFGTQWQRKGGLRYIVPGATEVKYEYGLVVKSIQVENHSWYIPNDIDIDSFDFTWHPDPTDPPLIYEFGTQHQKTGGPRFIVDEHAETKYVDVQIAKIKPNLNNWDIPKNINIDTTGFDFSWHPDSTEGSFKYVFGTQWQKTGGPTYVANYNTDSGTKYISTQIIKTLLLKTDEWVIPEHLNIVDFDYSWHPDDSEPPYIYEFGTQWHSKGGPRYIPPNTDVHQLSVKYVSDIIATVGPNKTNWIIPENLDTTNFDFSWCPDDINDLYIYQFGTQHQKTGGPKYVIPGATEIKYIDVQTAIALPNENHWVIPAGMIISQFDFSWHPDDTEEPYVYEFGTQWHDKGGPKYIPNDQHDLQVKYVSDVIATVGENKANWLIPDNLDTTNFDFSWCPDDINDLYIYQFGTQWQKTGGPKYKVEGATEVKYIDTQKAVTLPNENHWVIPAGMIISQFDFSWHPDDTEEPYVYEFGTQWHGKGGPRYIPPNTDVHQISVKYVSDIVATVGENKANWLIPDNLDTTNFDFSWCPEDNSSYIYVFGTQWQKIGGPVYKVEGATEVKYIDTQKAVTLPNKNNFELIDIAIADFDYSWHPDSTEEPFIYIFGNQWHRAELEPTIKYVVPGATEIKYINDIVATVAEYKDGWEILEDIESFDFSWRPNPTDPPYIYVFGNKQYPGTIMPTVKLHKTNATQEKFVDDIVATLASKPELFDVPELITDFDYSWRPNPKDPPYIYQFGTQWAKTNGPQYTVDNATEVKFIEYPVATIKPNYANWVVLEHLDVTDFDFSWHPDATSPPYIYVFGTQWQKIGGPVYKVEGATEIKYVSDLKAKSTIIHVNNWIVPPTIDKDSFDFTWYPDPTEEPFIYQFGTQWAKTNGPQYAVPNASETKFVNYPVAVIKKDMTNWVVPADINISNFDFSWHPDATSPPYIYQFGTIVDENDGPRYVTPGHNNEIVHLERPENTNAELHFSKYYIETTLEDLIAKHKGEVFWALNPDIDYSEFNFDWRPDIQQVKYVHAFGTSENINTQTYFVNTNTWYEGFTDINYIEDNSLVIRTTLDMFYVDRSNNDSQKRFLELQQRFPRIQKTRYLNSWVETINRCLNKSTTKLCWILNSELDYTDFEFDYYPNPWQMSLVHVFGTQYSHWGTTFMVNKDTFPEDTKYIKIIEHLSMINFVKNRRAISTDCLYNVYLIDHGNKETPAIVEALREKVINRQLTTIQYVNSYFETFKQLLKTLPDKKEHYIWVCSSICDYSNFDFKYICDPFAREQLHVFPSDKQKFGDTFLVDVNRLRELVDTMDMLEDYHKINYNQHMRVKRLPAPTVITEGDTHVSSIQTEFDWPYAIFVTQDNKDIQVTDIEPMSVWDEKHKNIIVTSKGATRIIVPKETKNYVQKELYDYPYMVNNFKLAESNPMDIIFISNGEACADENYEHLLKITNGTVYRIVRIDGVNGRVKSQHAAAETATTPWYFLVNAKLKVNKTFDFSWQPDRLQIPKHYIFNATNPVNGLEYGHQAIVANNKILTLNTKVKGLDFTLDSEHEVVPLNSGIAMYNSSAWDTWRTAFRETIKLRYSGTDENKERLNAWLNIGNGNFGEESKKGASDAMHYYDMVGGDLQKLMLSYDWAWLRSIYEKSVDL
jgi:hypothetical protein